MPEVTPEEAMVVEGDNVSLQCHPPNGSVTVGWHRGDAALSPGGRLWLSADNRTLTVTAAQRGDAGPYGCHVANPISTNRSRDVNLTVACEWEGGEMGVGLRCGLLSCCVVLLCCCWVGLCCCRVIVLRCCVVLKGCGVVLWG